MVAILLSSRSKIEVLAKRFNMNPILLASALLIFCICHPALTQTSNQKTGSPDIANHVDPPLATAVTTDRQPVSAQARAEAKRLYKEGVKYSRTGLLKQAIEIFSRAIELNPDYADAYYELGNAYFKKGELQKALESVRELLRLKPKDVDGKSLLANIELALQPENETSPRKRTEPAKPATELPEETQVAANVTSDPVASKESEGIDESLTRIYRVGAGDVLDVRMTDSPTSQSTLFTVTAAGLLENPNLPDPVSVAGLTIEEITTALQADLKRRAIQDTTVRVTVRDYGSHAILVSGLAKETGTKLLRREAIPLYVVIADAQPLPEAARVTLVRSQSKEVLTIDLTETKDMNRLVLPGDVITFHPSVTQFFYVAGEVKSPGEKTFRRGLTLAQAIIIAGGVTQRSKEAQVARDSGDGFLVVSRYRLKDIVSGKLRDPLIQPGDRIMIVD
jgi:protein involved in polysaccharide export with SLBB domain